MVAIAEPRLCSALTGTACRCELLDSSGEDHGCVESCVDGHVDFKSRRVRWSTGEARRRKPAQRMRSLALTRSRECRRGAPWKNVILSRSVSAVGRTAGIEESESDGKLSLLGGLKSSALRGGGSVGRGALNLLLRGFTYRRPQHEGWRGGREIQKK